MNPSALFIKRHLRHFFQYLILDEVHEEKGSDTAQGHAAGALAACCRKVIALTGTLIGGYAEHLRPHMGGAGGIVVQLPGDEPLRAVVVNGKPTMRFTGTHAIIAELPAKVRFTR